MESITIKVDEKMAREIDEALVPYYSTKTEFIREAMREKLISIKKDKVMLEMKKYFGKVKTKTSDQQLRQIRDKVGREITEKFGLKLD